MYINELSENSDIQISVKVNKEEYIYDATLLQIYQEPYRPNMYCIGCAPIEEDGKLLGFGDYPMHLLAHDNTNGRDYKWTIAMHGFNKDRTQFLLLSNESVKPINHRNAYRVPCSYKAVTQLGTNKSVIDGYAHDISYSGISITFAKDAIKNATIGTDASVSLYDEHGHVRRAVGKVTRIVDDFENGKKLIGIVFTQPSLAVTNLVAYLQRNELRINNPPQGRRR